MNASERARILALAVAAARRAGRGLRARFASSHRVTKKGRVDLVTEMDRWAQASILRDLSRAFPAHTILSEEGRARTVETASRDLWIVDPLDGTTNYAHRLPWFAVSIAYARDGVTQAGAVYHPMAREIFTALRGGGAALNGAPIRVSRRARLSDSVLATGFPVDTREHPFDPLDTFANFAVRTRGIRRFGAAAIDLCYVACGRFDGFWELRLHRWDTAAGALIVEEAGGTVTDFDGSVYDPDGDRLLATNGRLHPAMVRVLTRRRPMLRSGLRR